MSASGAAYRAADGSDEPALDDERLDGAAEEEDDEMGEDEGPDTSDGSLSEDMADDDEEAAPPAAADTAWLQQAQAPPAGAAKAAAHPSAAAPAATASPTVGGVSGVLSPALAKAGEGAAGASGSTAAPSSSFALRPGAPTFASMAAKGPATVGAQAPSRLPASAPQAGGLTGLQAVAAALPGASATTAAQQAASAPAAGGITPTGLFTVAAAKVAPENMAPLQPDAASLVSLIANGRWRALGWARQDATFVYLSPDPEHPFLLRSLTGQHYTAAQEVAFRDHVFSSWKAFVSGLFPEIGRALKPVDVLVVKGQPEWGEGLACLSFCVRIRWADCAPLISALLEGKTLTIPVSLDRTKPGPRLAANIHTWVLTSPANRQLGGAAGTAIYAQIATLQPGGASRPARWATRREAIQSISYGGQAIAFWHNAEAPAGEDYTGPHRRKAETRQLAIDKATALHPHWGFLGISTAEGKEGPYFRLTCMNFSAQQAFEAAGEVLLPIYTAEGESTLRLRFTMDIPGGDFTPEQRAANSALWREFDERFWPTAMWMEVVYTHHAGESAYTARFLLDALAKSVAKKVKWGPRKPLRLMEVPPTVPEGPTAFFRTHERSELLSRIYFAVDWADFKLLLTPEFCQIFLPQGDLCGKAVLFPHYKSAGGGRPRMTITTPQFRRNAWLAALPQDRPSNPPPVERRRRRGAKRTAEPLPDFDEEVACPLPLSLLPPAFAAALSLLMPTSPPFPAGQLYQCNAVVSANAGSLPACSLVGALLQCARSALHRLPSLGTLTYIASPPYRQRTTRTRSSRVAVSLRRRHFLNPRPLSLGSALHTLPRFLPIGGCWLPSATCPLGLAPTVPNLGTLHAWNCNSSPALSLIALRCIFPTNHPPRLAALCDANTAALPPPCPLPLQVPRPTFYLFPLEPAFHSQCSSILQLLVHMHMHSSIQHAHPPAASPSCIHSCPPPLPPAATYHSYIYHSCLSLPLPYLTHHLARLLLSLCGDVHPNPGPVLTPPTCFQLVPSRDVEELAFLHFLVRHNVEGDGHCGFYALALSLGLLPLPAHPGIKPPVNAQTRAVVRALRHTLTSALASDSPFHVEYVAQVFGYTPAELEARISALRLDFLLPGTWGCLHNLRSWISCAHFRAMAVALQRPIISFSTVQDGLTGTLSFNVHSPIPQYNHFRIPTTNFGRPFLYYEAGAAMPTRIANLCLQEIYSLMPHAGSPIVLSFEDGNHWVPLIPLSRYPTPPPPPPSSAGTHKKRKGPTPSTGPAARDFSTANGPPAPPAPAADVVDLTLDDPSSPPDPEIPGPACALHADAAVPDDCSAAPPPVPSHAATDAAPPDSTEEAPPCTGPSHPYNLRSTSAAASAKRPPAAAVPASRPRKAKFQRKAGAPPCARPPPALEEAPASRACTPDPSAASGHDGPGAAGGNGPRGRKKKRSDAQIAEDRREAAKATAIFGKKPDGEGKKRHPPHVSPKRSGNLHRCGAVPRDCPMTPSTPTAYPFPGRDPSSSRSPSPSTPPASPPRPSLEPRPRHRVDTSAAGLTILSLNICKAGRSSPSLGDLMSLIDAHRPDIICLSETPYAALCKPLTNLLRKAGYQVVFRPTPAPQAPIHSRYPSNRTSAPPSTGGVLCAVHGPGPYGHTHKPLRLLDKRLSPHITGVLISPLAGNPRLVLSVYMPHCMELYQLALAFLSKLPALYPTADITVAGDFQAEWEGSSRKSTLLTSALTAFYAPASPSTDPTFCPAHAPTISTCIDHILMLRDDPLLSSTAHTLSRTHTGFTDHKALLMHIPNSGLVFPPTTPSASPEARPATLKRPIPAGPLDVWAAGEELATAVASARASQTLRQLREDIDNTPSPHAHAELLRRADVVSTSLTDELQASLTRALAILPQIAAKPPTRRLDKPFWSRKHAKPHRTCHHRARVVRKLIHHVSSPPSSPALRPIWDVRASALYDSLTSLSLPPEAVHATELTPPPLHELTPASLQSLHSSHKKQAAWYAHAANDEAGADYAEYLTSLYNHKPQQAINLILRCYSDDATKGKLVAVRDAAGTLHTAPEAVVSTIHSLSTASLAKIPATSSSLSFPWSDPANPHSFSLQTKGPGTPILPSITSALYHQCLSRLAPNKATGPDGFPSELLQRMPLSFHNAVLELFQCMTILGHTPASWLHSTTVLLYKKGDATELLNYRPISLANSLYKLWTGLLTEVATDYAESHKLLSEAQEGFRKGHSCARAIAHLQLAFEDAIASGRNCFTTYIDFKGAYPSVDHEQLCAILTAMGMPPDFVRIVQNLYANATTSFLTPHGATPPVPILRGTLQGDPLSPLLFDLMIEPLLQWLARDNMGYVKAANHQAYPSQVYADDITLCTPSVSQMQLQLMKVEKFSAWSNIHPNVNKCAITAYVHDLQRLRKADRDKALTDMLCHVTLASARIPVLAQDAPLPCNYLGSAITADLDPRPQRRLALQTLHTSCRAIGRCPLPTLTKVRALAHMTGSKLRHTHGLAMYDTVAVAKLDSAIAGALKRTLPLSCGLATAAVQAPKPEIGLDVPSLMADYAATGTQVAIDVLNDQGPLGDIARASMARGAAQYAHWPLALALPTRDSLACRWLALAKLAKITLTDVPATWGGNDISTQLERMLYLPPSVNYPPPDPTFPPIQQVLIALIPLWRAGLTTWDSVLCCPRGAALPGGQPPLHVMSGDELLRVRPDLGSCPGLHSAMRYLTALLSTNSLEAFTKRRKLKAATALLPSSQLAPRWVQGLQLPPIAPPQPGAPQAPTSQTTITQWTEVTPLDGTYAAPITDGVKNTFKIHRKRSKPNRTRRPDGYYNAPLGHADIDEWCGDGATVLYVSATDNVPVESHAAYSVQARRYMVHWGLEQMTYARFQELEVQFEHSSCACASHPSPAVPPPDALCTVQWAPCFQHTEYIHTLRGGTEAIAAYHRGRHTDSRDAPEVYYRALRAKVAAATAACIQPTATSPAPPSPSVLSERTMISTYSINPCRDALPTGQLQAYRVPASSSDPGAAPLVRLCDRKGRAVGPRDLSEQRFIFLELQYHMHAKPDEQPFLDCLEALLLRYHPKSKRTNPQGNALKLSNHWAVPADIMDILRRNCGITTELFASPLNCSLAPGLTYCSAFPEDVVFGATHDCMQYQWTGSNEANPEYEPADMLAAMRRAIESACATDLPFSCVLILPYWKDSPYRHPELLTHPAVRLLTRVPDGHFKFVPPDVDTAGASAHTQAGAAKFGVDFYLVANKAGLATYITPNFHLLQIELIAALRANSGFQDLHVAVLPDIPDLPQPLDAPTLPMAPLSSSPGATVTSPPPPQSVQFSDLWLRNPSITHIPRFTLMIGKPLSVVEMCAGIATGLESLLAAGHYVHSYAWADINPAAWAATRHRIGLLHSRYPAQFPKSAYACWDTRLPFNISSISPAMLTQCFPEGIDVVIAGPPCQPYSSAGKRKGFKDPRSDALLATARILTFLNATQPHGVGYIIENVPGTERYPVIKATLGTGTELDAPACGSHARRAAIFWQNLQCPQELRRRFRLLSSAPTTSLNDMLTAHGFDGWRSQHLTLGKNMPSEDLYNQAGRDQKVLPKFVCYKGSHQFRKFCNIPALGLLRLDGELTIPTADIKEVCMGFTRGDTKAVGLSEDQRNHLLGQCIDLNLLSWLVSQLSTTPPGLPPPPPPPPAPTSPTPTWASLAFASGPPAPALTPSPRHFLPGSRPHKRRPLIPPLAPAQSCRHVLTELLPFPPRYRHDDYTYTDGSKSPDCPTLGAAVFHAPTGETVLIDATGFHANNTNNRAELVAIHQALLHHAQLPDIKILTDSLGSIQKIITQIRRPRAHARCHHLRLLEAVVFELVKRDRNFQTTSIHKVPAHANVPGNERADQGAKAVVMTHGQQLPTTVVHRLGAQPHRLPVWAFATPPPTEDPTAATQEPRAFTSLKQMRKYVTPILRLHTSRPSQYRTLFQHVLSHEGALLHLPSSHIQSRLRAGQVRHAMQLFKYLWGQLYCGKLAFRYQLAETDACPLCLYPDSCTHIGSGCPVLSGHYISRHDAAVRLVADYIAHCPKGACALHQSLRLLSQDAGLNPRPMTEDFEELLLNSSKILEEWEGVDLSHIPAGMDTRGTDVSLSVEALRKAMEAFEDHKAMPPTPLPKHLPDWLLPPAIAAELRGKLEGVTPDLVFGIGIPAVTDPLFAKLERMKCTIILIEVGFCADLRCHLKHQEKLDKYEHLLQALRLIWGTVHLVSVPVGCAGTVLARTQEALAKALASNPAHPPLKETTLLMKRVSAFAAQRLLTVIQARNCSVKAKLAAQGPTGTRGSQTHSLPLARRPP